MASLAFFFQIFLGGFFCLSSTGFILQICFKSSLEYFFPSSSSVEISCLLSRSVNHGETYTWMPFNYYIWRYRTMTGKNSVNWKRRKKTPKRCECKRATKEDTKFNWWQRTNACRQSDLTAKWWVVRATHRLSHYDRQYKYSNRIFSSLAFLAFTSSVEYFLLFISLSKAYSDSIPHKAHVRLGVLCVSLSLAHHLL